MEKLMNDFGYGLFLWQLLILVILIGLLITIVYFIAKLYIKVMRYLDIKTKELNK